MRLHILIPDDDDLTRYADWRAQASQIDSLLASLSVVPSDRAWTDDPPSDSDLIMPLMA